MVEFIQDFWWPIIAMSYYAYIKWKYMFRNGKTKD